MGCENNNEEELYNTDATNCETDSLTYTDGIAAIINANCATSGCHVPGGQPPDYSDYTSVVNNKARLEVRAIEQKTMPPGGPLSNCNIAKLEAWLGANTPEE